MAIAEEFENTLSRDGTAPNDMLVDLDMGNHRVINVGSAVDVTDAMNKQDVIDMFEDFDPEIGNLLEDIEAAEAATAASAAAAQEAQVASEAALASFSATQYATRANAVVGTSTAEYLRLAGYNASGDGGASLYKKSVTEPSHPGKFQNAAGTWYELKEDFLRPEHFGAVGNGTTDDATALTNLFSQTNSCIIGNPNRSYKTTVCVQPKSGQYLRDLKLIADTITGFTSVETSTGRHTASNCIVLVASVDGLTIENLDVTSDGVNERSFTGLDVYGGFSTKPLVMRGDVYVHDIPGVNGAVSFNGIGAAGAFINDIRTANIGTNKPSRNSANQYWTREGAHPNLSFINPTGLVIDGDVSVTGFSTGRVNINRLIGKNTYLGGEAYSIEGDQTDFLTLAGVGGATAGGWIGLVECDGVGEVIDHQARNWVIDDVKAKNTRFCVLKFVHGAQDNYVGHVHGDIVARAHVGFFGSVNSNDTRNNVVGMVTGTETGGFILDTGTAQAGSTSSTFKLKLASSSFNNFYTAGGYGVTVIITGGTGIGQERTFTTYTAATQVLSGISTNWGVTPDATSTYKLLPYSERAAVVFEGEDVGKVIRNRVDGVAVRDNGGLDYLVRANLTVVTAGNRVVIAEDYGTQLRPVNIAVAGTVAVTGGPALRSVTKLGMSTTQSAPTPGVETLVVFDTARQEGWRINGGAAQASTAERGIRVRLPGPKNISAQVVTNVNAAAGENYRIGVYRNNVLIHAQDFQAYGAQPVFNSVNFAHYHDETWFGSNENLYTVKVLHATTGRVLNNNAAFAYFSIEG